MLNYGAAGLTNTEALEGLADTARTINKHLLMGLPVLEDIGLLICTEL